MALDFWRGRNRLGGGSVECGGKSKIDFMIGYPQSVARQVLFLRRGGERSERLRGSKLRADPREIAPPSTGSCAAKPRRLPHSLVTTRPSAREHDERRQESSEKCAGKISFRADLPPTFLLECG